MWTCRFDAPRPFLDGRFFMLALAGLAWALSSCEESARRREAAPAIVTEGMTMSQVLELWGAPDVRVRQDAGERWSYWLRDRRNHVIGRTYVLFDADERVSDVVRTQPDGKPLRPERVPVTAT